MIDMLSQYVTRYALKSLAILGIVIGLLALPGAASAHGAMQDDEPHRAALSDGIPAPEQDNKTPAAGHVNCHGIGANCHAFTAIIIAHGQTVLPVKDRLIGRTDQVRRDPPPFLPFRPPIAG